MTYAEELELAYDAVLASEQYQAGGPVTMSMLGRCRRQVAYAIRDGETRNRTGTTGAAFLGTVIHNRVLAELAWRLDGYVEQEVRLAVPGLPELYGTADLVLPGAVVDLKTVSGHYYAVVTEHTPLSHRMQATGYALATGSDTAILLYVNRDTGERFTVAWAAKDYSERLLDWLADANRPPEQVARDERGPGLSMICDECPFMEECWGPIKPGQEPQGVVANEVGIEEALLRYAEARQAMKNAEADKTFWRKVLSGAPKGLYGIWKLGWSKVDTERLDTTEAERMLIEAGLPVPIKIRHETRINVRQVPDAKEPAS